MKISLVNPLYPNLPRLLRAFWLLRRGLSHLRFMDFANHPGRIGYVLYGLGAIDFWHDQVSANAAAVRLGEKARAEAS